MKYAGMPFGMWVLFAGSFQKQLTAVLGYDAATARAITKKAKPQYRQIIAGLPEFEKADRFKMNLVSLSTSGRCGMERMNAPSIAQLTMFILKRSDFSNSGRSAMIALYFGFAFFVIACAASAS